MNNQHQQQHKKITGYRDLSQHEIDLMNKIKAIGSDLQKIIEEVEQHNLTLEPTSETYECLSDTVMWVQQSKINLKIGLMALTRAVAKPTSF